MESNVFYRIVYKDTSFAKEDRETLQEAIIRVDTRGDNAKIFKVTEILQEIKDFQ